MSGRNSQACSIMCSYGNEMETSFSSYSHTCTNLGITIAAEVKEKGELKTC